MSDHVEGFDNSAKEERLATELLVREALRDEADPSDEVVKKLIRKIDYRLVPPLAFLYAIALVDRSNLPNARLAGMDQELGISIGNRYTFLVMVRSLKTSVRLSRTPTTPGTIFRRHMLTGIPRCSSSLISFSSYLPISRCGRLDLQNGLELSVLPGESLPLGWVSFTPGVPCSLVVYFSVPLRLDSSLDLSILCPVGTSDMKSRKGMRILPVPHIRFYRADS